MEYGPQNSRGFRALKVWLSLQQVGRSGYARMIRNASAEAEAYLNRLNEALLERIQASGELFVSNAVVAGQFLLRACIVNFHTQPADVDALPEIVVRLGRELDTVLRTAEA